MQKRRVKKEHRDGGVVHRHVDGGKVPVHSHDGSDDGDVILRVLNSLVHDWLHESSQHHAEIRLAAGDVELLRGLRQDGAQASVHLERRIFFLCVCVCVQAHASESFCGTADQHKQPYATDADGRERRARQLRSLYGRSILTTHSFSYTAERLTFASHSRTWRSTRMPSPSADEMAVMNE